MERLYTVKKSILPESFYRFSVIQINIPEGLIYGFNEMFLQSFWKNKLGGRVNVVKDGQCEQCKLTIKPE